MATNVYRGSDGTISVAVETGPEGDLASAINDEYGLTPVGRVSGVTVRVTNEVRPFHELGQRFATELRPGNINVQGTIARAHVNGALLKLMLGPAAQSRPRADAGCPPGALDPQSAGVAGPQLGLHVLDDARDRGGDLGVGLVVGRVGAVSGVVHPQLAEAFQAGSK